MATVSVEPIQVILGAEALVAYKATAIRVIVESTFSNRVWAEINVTYNFGTRSYLETGPSGNGIPIDPGSNRIYLPGGPVFSPSTTQQPWLQSHRFYWTTTGDDDNIAIELDPLNKVTETNEANNWKATEMKVAESKLLKILVVPVYFPMMAQLPFYPSPEHLIDQFDFLRDTYPVADNGLKLTFADARAVWKLPPPPDPLWDTFNGNEWLYRNVVVPISTEAKNLGYERVVIVIDYSTGWNCHRHAERS